MRFLQASNRFEDGQLNDRVLNSREKEKRKALKTQNEITSFFQQADLGKKGVKSADQARSQSNPNSSVSGLLCGSKGAMHTGQYDQNGLIQRRRRNKPCRQSQCYESWRAIIEGPELLAQSQDTKGRHIPEHCSSVSWSETQHILCSTSSHIVSPPGERSLTPDRIRTLLDMTGVFKDTGIQRDGRTSKLITHQSEVEDGRQDTIENLPSKAHSPRKISKRQHPEASQRTQKLVEKTKSAAQETNVIHEGLLQRQTKIRDSAGESKSVKSKAAIPGASEQQQSALSPNWSSKRQSRGTIAVNAYIAPPMTIPTDVHNNSSSAIELTPSKLKSLSNGAIMPNPVLSGEVEGLLTRLANANFRDSRSAQRSPSSEASFVFKPKGNNSMPMARQSLLLEDAVSTQMLFKTNHNGEPPKACGLAESKVSAGTTRQIDTSLPAFCNLSNPIQLNLGTSSKEDDLQTRQLNDLSSTAYAFGPGSGYVSDTFDDQNPVGDTVHEADHGHQNHRRSSDTMDDAQRCYEQYYKISAPSLLPYGLLRPVQEISRNAQLCVEMSHGDQPSPLLQQVLSPNATPYHSSTARSLTEVLHEEDMRERDEMLKFWQRRYKPS